MATISFTVPDALVPALQEAFLQVRHQTPREAIVTFVKEVYRQYRREQLIGGVNNQMDSELSGVV